jgi:hypothetical protein
MNQRSVVMTLGIGFMLGLATAGVLLKKSETPSTASPPEILKLIKEQETAWNAGQLEEFMKGYWQSEELAFRSGDTLVKGYQATLERYRKRYQQDGAEMGKLTFSELEVEMLSKDQALVTGRWQLKQKKDEPGGLFTLRLRYFAGTGWRIISDHTSAKERKAES